MTSPARRLLCSFVVPVLLTCTPGLARAQQAARPPAKLDRVLAVSARQLWGRSRVIVQFHGAPDVRVIISSHGVAGRALRGVSAQVAELDNAELERVASDPRVARVMADRPAFATMERTRAAVGVRGLASRGLNGAGVGIAVIDSGVYAQHPDFGGGWSRTPLRHFQDFTLDRMPSVWSSPVARDGFGHGTHVAGILVGNGAASSGAREGLAPGANLVVLKALDDQGHGYVSDVIDAFDYAVANRRALGIRIINLSVGSGVYESYATDPLAQAARRAVDAGIVVVAAAGNLGQNARHETQFGGISSPGNAPWVLTVGAASHSGTTHRDDDTIGAFSSRGPTWIDFGAKPDLVAPGVGIESTSDPDGRLYQELSDYLLDGADPDARFKPYLSLSGTSMAAPVVTGTVALMLQLNPALTPNAVKGILQYTAEVRSGERILAQGAGLLNARGALRLARHFARPDLPLGEMRDVIEGQSITWARHLIWGNYRVTGGVPLPGGSAWARGQVWGALDTPAGASVVWGAASQTSGGSSLWGAQALNVVWSEAGDDNVVWSENGDDNVVWSEATVQNVVWGRDCGGLDCTAVVWGARGASDLAWGTANPDDNVVWSEAAEDNVVWSEDSDDNVVWSEEGDDNVVWSESARSRQVLWAPAIDDRRYRVTNR